MSRSCVERLEPRTFFTAVLPGFSQTAIVGNLVQPTAMEFAPDGRLFISQKRGQLLVVKNGQALPTPFATLDVDERGEFGLMGIAFDPNFANNHFVYVYRTVNTPYEHNQVTRLTADPNNPDVMLAGSEKAIIDLPKLSSVHHGGGAIHFGPDGKLYLGPGENYVPANAQSLSNPLGKILRINKDGSIPPDNPFYNQTKGQARAIWALGLRNPFTFAFQPGTGRMFINDVGNATWEEIDEGVAGANYGWPSSEGPTSNPKFKSPFYAYHHGPADETGGSCIAGGAFYNPPASATANFPAEFTGDYFYADYTGGYIKVIDLSDPTKAGAVTTFATGLAVPVAGTPGPVDLKVGPDGALYSLQIGYSTVERFSFTDSSAPSIDAPPASQLASVGHPVTFTVSASGAAPIAYQWQRNGVDIPGATASSYTIDSAQLADNGAQYRVVLTNAAGSLTSDPATLSVTAAQPPNVTINLPAQGTLYRAGDTISFAASATDPQDGALAASAYTWTVLLHHDTHTHPFMDATSGITSGTFTIPTDGEVSPNVYYLIQLRVTDSAGLSTFVTREVHPQISQFTLATNVPELGLTLDGQPVDSGTTVTGVQGIERTLAAPPSQAAGDTIYDFVGWSDGGAVTHTIATPDVDTTYTAIYQPRAGAATGPDPTATIDGALPATIIGGEKGRLAVRITNNGNDVLSGPLTFRLLLSADGTIDENDAVLATVEKKLKLQPGRSAAVKLRVEYPTIDNGSYQLLAQIDPDNTIAETDEQNNTADLGAVNVERPVVDLSGTFVTPTPATVAPGGRTTLVLDVANGGNVLLRGTATIAVTATTNSSGVGGTNVGSVIKRLKLKPDGHVKVKIRCTVPADLTAGNYFFAATVDSIAQIVESNEANNVVVSGQPVQVG